MPRGSNKNGFARRFRRGNEGSVGRYHARSHGAVALLLSDRRAFPAIERGSASWLRGTRAQLGSLPHAVRDALTYPFEIGRAPGRESVGRYGVNTGGAGSVKKK